MKLVLLLIPFFLFAQQDKDKKDASPPPPSGTISGTVLMAGTNTPMRDVEVYANRGAGDAVRVLTDALGHYTLKDITPGPKRVSATAPDSSGRHTGFGPNSQRQIRLAPGQDLTGIDFHLVVYSTISGRVVDQNKEPVVGISVFLIAREYSHGRLRAFFAGSGQTDDEGYYTIGRVTPGRAYAVMAAKRLRTLPAQSEAPLDPALRLPAFVPTFYPNAANVDGGEMLTLRPAEAREGVDIRVLRAPSFCFDAVVEGISGPQRFDITETQPTSGQSGSGGFYTAVPGGQTGADGKIRVCDLHPGDYELSTYTWAGSGPFQGRNGFASTTVTIGDRDVTGVHLLLRQKLPVNGEVAWDGAPPETPPTAKLTLNVQAITRTERANTESEIPGAFSFKDGLLMDEYRLDIGRTPPGAYVKDVIYGGHSILYTGLPVGAASGDPALRVVLAGDGVRVAAKVTDKDGNPVADCTVVVIPADAANEAVFAAAMKSGKTDQSGEWTTAALAPGKYYAIATEDPVDRSPECISALWKARTSATEVDAASNGKPSVTLSLRPLK
jgi:hypothetical protein